MTHAYPVTRVTGTRTHCATESDSEICTNLNGLARPSNEAILAEEQKIAAQLHWLSDQFPRYRFKQMYLWLRRNGFNWNHRRVLRIYQSLGLIP